MYSIAQELTGAIFVHVYAARLAVMNLTVRHNRIRSGFHFETGYTIVVNIVAIEITLKIDRFAECNDGG